ncbi:DUF484 family protein [Maricurvus nonylphenolicus]|uniref:DUF484 family protein n=1 Tax=Maricurvus nonylphenolicus TaxID=1008307 RepID=UPI0036F1BB82
MSDQTLVDSQTPVTEAQVADYLRKHPDFFVKQPGLLADLRLPHESGEAVSLIERQVSVLRERNMDMRHRLSKLLDNARDNDKLFDKTKRLVLALLEGQDLATTINSLFYSFDNDFQIHYTTLLIYGDKDTLKADRARVVTLAEARPFIGNLLKANRAMCGTFSEEETTYLFGENAKEIGSVALVPLIHGNSFGLLAIGNRDPQYYRSSMGTLFLSYIAEVLNRSLPRHLPR